ncbi:MAG: hypothetical protein OWV35_05765, partial [Firmicutes bacterium]|nr:hypothetical protein [Bacillota bacterium]
PARFRFAAGPPPAAEPAAASELRTAWDRRWWILDLPGSARWLRPLQAGAAGALGVLAVAVTHLVLVAGVLGVAALWLPPILLDGWARARWRAADRAAYALANTLRYTLALAGHPRVALMRLAPEADPPLRGWLAEALARDRLGREPLEQGLARLADRLGHAELRLLADILATDRAARPADDLLADLLAAWGGRLAEDEQRLGQLASGQLLSWLFTAAPIGAWLAGWVLDPTTMAVFRASALGQGLALAGLGVLLAGLAVAQHTLRQADPAQFEEAAT